jgi:hypothetical protein
MPVDTTVRKYYFDDDFELPDAPVSAPTHSTHPETQVSEQQEVQVERHLPEEVAADLDEPQD